MKTYFDYQFNEWCAMETNGTVTKSAWGNSKQQAITNFNNIK